MRLENILNKGSKASEILLPIGSVKKTYENKPADEKDIAYLSGDACQVFAGLSAVLGAAVNDPNLLFPVGGMYALGIFYKLTPGIMSKVARLVGSVKQYLK